MTSKERMLRALNREKPDRLPVTVHQWQTYHLEKYLGGIDALEAFKKFGLDASIQHFEAMGQFWLPEEVESKEWSKEWREEVEKIKTAPDERITHHKIITPEGELSYTTGGNRYTTWVTEYMIKKPDDIELIRKYMPVPKLNKKTIEKEHALIGDRGILRGFVWGEQAGCWQHACCLHGTQEMIMAAIDTPQWVHRFLSILLEKKLQFIEESLKGAKFDIIETGGGAASSTVISPKMFEEFCLPYDRKIHDALHNVGHKVTYHTCGGMMPILELIVETHTDASETLAPSGVGGDVDIGEVKRKIGSQVALIGGMEMTLARITELFCITMVPSYPVVYAKSARK